MREITSDNLTKLVVKKATDKISSGQDITYICSSCGYTEKEFALNSRNHKVCQRCSNLSVKASLLPTLNWVESDIQPPELIGD